ncbi:MAG: hypothetical protein COU65_03855 [Candidatus Pacebacteria bacterium CG10_big_fil_rev_8_21_14_0_10_42_12]|nr:MAG: hypothetical protein COU65_03855 [Candidatus Pacebacteria bacterium CG10_big_fil_rev_8_21_14_0_10_42_12]
MAAQPSQPTTQVFLDIHDITNDLLIMKDGTTSLIISVDAMNFGLLAEQEQDAIMYAYAGLLNSLNYPIQIVINSQTKDVTAYLRLLEEKEAETLSPVMQSRIHEYRTFVANLIHERNVLDKKFYVVIPASALELGLVSAASVMPGAKPAPIENIERSVIIEKATNLLHPKRDHIIGQFARIGLFSRQLTTQEIIQLFYVKYNPEAAEGQHIAESNSYSTPLVRAQIQEDTMDINQQPTPVASVAPVAPEPVVSEQPAQSEAQPDPAPVVSEMPPVETQVETPMMSQVETIAEVPVEIPEATPTEPIASAPVAPVAPTPAAEDVDGMQADLNNTLQELGQAPAQPVFTAPTETPVTAAPAPTMPPLPEI